jgi:hypothetical protein
MTTFNIAGHTIKFADCHEVGQGGPDTCTMSINGDAVTIRSLWGQPRKLRFHPTPLEFDGDVLVPLWQTTRFYLVRINIQTLRLKRLSKGFKYMRLLLVEGAEVEFSTWWDDREKRRISLARA